MRGRTDGRARPWSRALADGGWSRRALVAVAVAGLALLAIPAGNGGAADRLVLLYLPLLLVVGLVPRRPPLPVVVPAAAISFVVGFGASGDLDGPVAIHFLLVLAIGTALAAALADPLSGNDARADGAIHLGLPALIDGTRALEGATTVDGAITQFERALVGLLGADGVRTFLVGHGVPAAVADLVDLPARRFVAPGEGWSSIAGHPLPADVHPGGRSGLVIPLGTATPRLGVVLVAWDRTVAPPNEEVAQAIDLLAAEAVEAIERVRSHELLERAPHTDPLTGLLARRMIRTRLADLEAGDVVVVIDLDGFRSYNAVWGSGAGDRTVRTLAACLVDSCRRDDWCGRLSDEEFIVVFRGAGASASAAVSRVRDRWAELATDITFSAGVAVHQRGQGPADTLAHAEGALDLAKDRGRDRVELFPGGPPFDAG